MSLRDWLENRWLVEHQPSPEETGDLLAVVDRDLQDAAVDRLSADWRLGIAYNAALQLAILALSAEGYRPERQRSHERAVQSLWYTAIDGTDVVVTTDSTTSAGEVFVEDDQAALSITAGLTFDFKGDGTEKPAKLLLVMDRVRPEG